MVSIKLCIFNWLAFSLPKFPDILIIAWNPGMVPNELRDLIDGKKTVSIFKVSLWASFVGVTLSFILVLWEEKEMTDRAKGKDREIQIVSLWQIILAWDST